MAVESFSCQVENYRCLLGHFLGHITDPGREFLIGNSGKSTPNIVSTQFLQKTDIWCGSQVSLGLYLARGARWLACEVLEPTLVAAILPLRGHCLEASESRICEPTIVVGINLAALAIARLRG
jgi:hypothetical protein